MRKFIITAELKTLEKLSYYKIIELLNTKADKYAKAHVEEFKIKQAEFLIDWQRLKVETKEIIKRKMEDENDFIKALNQADDNNKLLRQEIERLKAEKLQAVEILKNPYTSFRESCYDCIDYLTKID